MSRMLCSRGSSDVHSVVVVALAVVLALRLFPTPVLLFRFTSSVWLRVLVLFWFTGFGVPSSFSVGWLLFLGCCGLLCTGFLRLLLILILRVVWLFFLDCCGLLYTGFLWLLLILILCGTSFWLLFITNGDGRCSFPCFLLLALSLIPLKLQFCVELTIIKPFHQPQDCSEM